MNLEASASCPTIGSVKFPCDLRQIDVDLSSSNARSTDSVSGGLFVRPVLGVSPRTCRSGERVPSAGSEAGFYELDATISDGVSASVSTLCVTVGPSWVDTAHLSKAALNNDVSIERNGYQTGWVVDLEVSELGRPAIFSLADACSRSEPTCPGTFGLAGHFVIVFDNAIIGGPVPGDGFRLLDDGRGLSVSTTSEEVALSIVERVNSIAPEPNEASPTSAPEGSAWIPVVAFLTLAVLIVVAFIWATARSHRRLEESLQPPDDLRRVGEKPPSAGGSPNGGSIWPAP